MPKIERELKKDLTPIQQEIKRKTQNPGTPADVSGWSGATSTKYREGSHIPAGLVLGFIQGAIFQTIRCLEWPAETLTLSLNLTVYKYLKLTSTLALSLSMSLSLSIMMVSTISMVDLCTPVNYPG
jgi:hypothetical protein